MILTAHQPAYLPWLGYFDKIARSDLFVFLDAVQFERNSFINRNRIKTANGPTWLTIPVLTKGHLSGTMRETRIDRQKDWRRTHLRSIAQSYVKAPFFDQCFPRLEALYATDDDILAELCLRHLRFWMAELGLTTKLVRLSDLTIAGAKSDLVRDLCLHFGARQYFSGALGRDYLDPAQFSADGIDVAFQDYAHPAYPQLYGPFVAQLSIVDAWMNLGPKTAELFAAMR